MVTPPAISDRCGMSSGGKVASGLSNGVVEVVSSDRGTKHRLELKGAIAVRTLPFASHQGFGVLGERSIGAKKPEIIPAP